nr:hypothetical protein [Tanacetum cinerariifolium]
LDDMERNSQSHRKKSSMRYIWDKECVNKVVFMKADGGYEDGYFMNFESADGLPVGKLWLQLSFLATHVVSLCPLSPFYEGKWETSSIPCKHAIDAIHDMTDNGIGHNKRGCKAIGLSSGQMFDMTTRELVGSETMASQPVASQTVTRKLVTRKSVQNKSAANKRAASQIDVPTTYTSQVASQSSQPASQDGEDETDFIDPIQPHVNVTEDDLEVLDFDSLESNQEDVPKNARSIGLRNLRKKHMSSGIRNNFYIGKEFTNRDLAKERIRSYVVETRRNLDFKGLVPTIAKLFPAAEHRKWETSSIPCRHAIDAIHDMTDNGIDVSTPEDWVYESYKLQTWMDVYTHKINPVNGRKWETSSIPCRHAIDAIHDMTDNGIDVSTPEDWVYESYKLQTWMDVYTHKINPVNGSKKSKGEIAMVKGDKLTRKGKKITCSNCKGIGHNKRGCKAIGLSGGQMFDMTTREPVGSETMASQPVASQTVTRKLVTRKFVQNKSAANKRAASQIDVPTTYTSQVAS